MKRRAALIATALLAVAPAPAQAATLQLGFLDGVFSSGERAPWLQRAAESGSSSLRLDIGWPASEAPTNAADPSDPAYDFSTADASIKAAVAAGQDVLIAFTGAPTWAEGPDRPADAPTGSWRPSPAAIEGYARALGTRYAGGFPDPAQPGATLPRVRAFQLWNEPNLSKYLSPQWEGGEPAAPAHYREMLNAFYTGIKATNAGALVVTAGTGPFGDPDPGGTRMMPARFVRELLCLRERGETLRPVSCPAPAQFDVLSHHPYSVGAPTRKALNADDVSIPDIPKLTGIVRAAERHDRALPEGTRHRIWVTEVSYDSSPPDPDGVPATRHAAYLAQTLYLLSRAGVERVFWYQIRDQAPEPSYGATSQSGLFTREGEAKPAARAYRFPFYPRRDTRGRAAIWGVAPAQGPIAIQRRTATGWRTVKTVSGRASRTFATTVPAAGTVMLRARQGVTTTLSWRVR